MKTNNNWKRIIYVLTFCMLVINVFVMNRVTVNAAENTTLYFFNPEGWDTVYGYVWDDSGEEGQTLGTWPGTKAEKSALGANWYQVTVTQTGNFHIIMNNGIRTDGQEAQYDAYVETGGCDIYISTIATVGNTIFSSKEATEQAKGYTTVYFKNSRDWTSVYGYIYRDEKPVGADWPGVQLETATAKGDKWYQLVVPLKAAETPFGVVFSDGANIEQSEVWISDENNVYVTPASEAFASSAEADEAIAAEQTETNPDLEYDIELSGTGANLPYTTYEAESAVTNAEVLESKRGYQTDIQSEASGRQAVKLTNNGDYVEFTLLKPTDAMVLRYSMPDSQDGAGINATLDLYVNDKQEQPLSLTSEYAWIYGEYPYTNNPADGLAHRYFDEMRLRFDKTLPAGTKIKLQKDSSNTAENYVIDFIDCEQIKQAVSQPENSLSITDYGAKANDGVDDAAAIRSCITDAASQGKIVWIPEGTFTVSEKKAFEVSDVTIQGAGMWYSVLEGAGAAFKYKGTCKFYDFAMTGVATIRKDSEDLAGFEAVGSARNVTIENIWMEHMKVGIWSYSTYNMVVQGCRIRNTYADGINLSSGTNQTMVRNNNIRNTGDDGIAIWPQDADGSNNTIAYNTVQIPTLANGIAVYGGNGNTVKYNYVADTVVNGAGICLGTMFPVKNGFTGTTTVTGNMLKRCGSWHYNYDYPVGALWFCASNYAMTAEFNISEMEIFDCSYPGIMFECWREVSGVTIADTNVYGATDGIYVRGDQKSSVTVENIGLCDLNGQQTNIENTNFTLNTKGNGIYNTTRPEEEVPCAHNNKETRNKKEASCKETGYTGDIYCADCAEKLEEGTVIEKSTIHGWDEGMVTIPATETTDGEKTYTCTVCGAEKKESIPATGDNTSSEGGDENLPGGDELELSLLPLEGELADISGGATVPSVTGAFNGGYVGNIGGQQNGIATFNVNADVAGKRTLKIYYSTAEERQLNVVVNDNAPITLTCNGTDWYTPNTEPVITEIELQADENIIRFTGVSGGYAPNIDRIEIALTEEEAQKLVQNLIDNLPDAAEVTTDNTMQINAVKLSYDAVAGQENIEVAKLTGALEALDELVNESKPNEEETDKDSGNEEETGNGEGSGSEEETGNEEGSGSEEETGNGEGSGNEEETGNGEGSGSEEETGNEEGSGNEDSNQDRPCTHTNKTTRDEKEASCKEAGYTGNIYCTDCGEKLEEGTIIEKLATHNWDAGEVTTPATETTDGEMTYTCVICDAEKKVSIPATGNGTEMDGTPEGDGKENQPEGDQPGKEEESQPEGDQPGKEEGDQPGKEEGSQPEGDQPGKEEGSQPEGDQPGKEEGSQTGKQPADGVSVTVDENGKDSADHVETVIRNLTSNKKDKDFTGSVFAELSLRVTQSKTTSNQLKWNKVKGADGYVVLAGECGEPLRVVNTIKKANTTSWNHKSLKRATCYKYVVLAYKEVNGTKDTISISKTIYVATSGGKYTNIKSVKVNKTKVTLKKNKTFTIKANEVKDKNSKKISRYRKLCYESSNTKIATVSQKGKIKAKKKGTCYIYVYAQNGLSKKIKVIVK